MYVKAFLLVGLAALGSFSMPARAMAAQSGVIRRGVDYRARYFAHKLAAERAAGIVGDGAVNLPRVQKHLDQMREAAFFGRFPLEPGFARGVATYALEVTAAKLREGKRVPGPRRSQSLLDASYNLKHYVGSDRFAADPELVSILKRAASASR